MAKAEALKSEPKKAAPKKAGAKVPKAKKAAASEETAELGGRADRKVREGVVASNKMTKTVVVAIERQVQHPIYGKVVLRSNKFKAHDELSCDVGDKVEIMETRPLSRDKRWRVVRIVEKVK